MHNAAIIAKHVSVVRESVRALDNVTCNIATGKLTGLIGPSGSGKTTLMRALIGAQQLTKGSLSVLGYPAGDERLRSQIGYVTQLPAVYKDLTVRQNLHYFAAIVGSSKADITQAIDLVDLKAQTNQMADTLSGGQLARVSLAIALLGKPSLLILDEPTVGLDPVLRRDLWKLFNELADSGRTLLISSHVMDEAEQCGDILLLREGKVLSNSSRKELLTKTGTTSVEAAFLALVGGAHAS